MDWDGMGAFAAEMQRLLLRLVRNYELCEESCLAKHGVTASQGYALLAIPEGSDVTMNELSEAMGLANSTMTRTVDHLVRKGLVSRRHDEEDRRVVCIELSATGQQVRQTLEKERQGLMQGILGETPEGECAAILAALERVTGLIERAVQTCCKR